MGQYDKFAILIIAAVLVAIVTREPTIELDARLSGVIHEKVVETGESTSSAD